MREAGGKRSKTEDAQRLFDLAVRSLARSNKTRSRMERDLLAQGASSHAVESVLRNLEQRGYLNDEVYASHWAEARLAKKPMGRLRLSQELLNRGFSERLTKETISRGYAAVTESELAVRALKELGGRKTPRQLGRFLEGRGFTAATIARVLHLDETEN